MSAGKRKLWHEENDFANLKNCKKLKSDTCFKPLKKLNQFPNSSSFFSPKSSKTALPAIFSHLSSNESLNEDEKIDSLDENSGDDLINSIVDVDDEQNHNEDIDSIIDDDNEDDFYEPQSIGKKDDIQTKCNNFSHSSMVKRFIDQDQFVSKPLQLSESTPKKFHADEDECNFIDSGNKKKQKFVESGLAHRLKMLIQQKQRDKIFRSHRMKMISATGEHERSHQIITCELSSRGITAGQLTLFDCILKNGSIVSSTDDRTYRYKILINKHLASELQVGIASLVDVTSPWYILSLGEHTKVIFSSSCSRSK